MSLLSIRDLSLSIHGQSILDNVNIEVQAGRIHGLIGESGSGKSMTALSVMRLLPYGSEMRGSIQLSGQELTGLSEAEMCGLRGDEIGMVFQEPMTALNPVQTIGAQVAETVLQHHGGSRRAAQQEAQAALIRVGLTPDRVPMQRYPHQLSGGQRQRVVIAAAIVRHPKLLIADEPTTALDVTTQAQILQLIRKLVNEDGMGAIFITHDLAVVSGLADDISIMRHGRVVEAGPVHEVFGAIRHPYTKALFEASVHQPDRATESHDAPMLELRDLVRRYPARGTTLFRALPDVTAVDGVSLTIRRGESVGLVGESGCGKSTLTRALLGLEAWQGGTMQFDGQPVPAPMPRHIRARMQVVFQDPYGSFNPRHKVSRLVAEPFHLLDAPPKGDARRTAVAEALESVGLQASDADKYIHEFSGGQRQRIAIARVLIIKPELIILDEAVSALDVSIRAQILDLLADLSERFGLSYLFISHDLHVVRRITDRVLVMKAGKIVEEGPTEDVLSDPQHPYTIELMAAAPVLEVG
ncbi:ABC transporter ATP-binding protein [Halovulum sp. GXIMD14793]